jgi:CCR4-NOT transcription complex subunit 6
MTGSNGGEGDDNSSNGWVEVCTSQTFTPSPSDVGRRFRLECSAVLIADGTTLFGPKSIRTEPVLGSPTPPRKRVVNAVKGASSGGGFRFRILSYNVLAEIYATQQMYPSIDYWALGD